MSDQTVTSSPSGVLALLVATGQSTDSKTKKRRSTNTNEGSAEKCVAAGEVSIEQEVAAISHLEERTIEEDGILSNALHGFHLHMQKSKKERDPKSMIAYVRRVKQLMVEHRRSIAAMGSEEYFKLVKGFPRNKHAHGSFSAAVMAFRTFMQDRGGRLLMANDGSPWEKASDGDKLYTVGELKKPSVRQKSLPTASVDGMKIFMAGLCKKGEEPEASPSRVSAPVDPCTPSTSQPLTVGQLPTPEKTEKSSGSKVQLAEQQGTIAKNSLSAEQQETIAKNRAAAIQKKQQETIAKNKAAAIQKRAARKPAEELTAPELAEQSETIAKQQIKLESAQKKPKLQLNVSKKPAAAASMSNFRKRAMPKRCAAPGSEPVTSASPPATSEAPTGEVQGTAGSSAVATAGRPKKKGRWEETAFSKMEHEHVKNANEQEAEVRSEVPRKGQAKCRGRGKGSSSGISRGGKRKDAPSSLTPSEAQAGERNPDKELAVQKLEALPAASETELTGFNAVAEAFRAHISAKGLKASEGHFLQLWALFQEDEKSLSIMASDEYSQLVVACCDNGDNGQFRKTTLRSFAEFWNGLTADAQEVLLASDSGSATSGATKHEARLRRELSMAKDWRLSITPTRDRGDIIEVRSHDGRVWTSMEDVKTAAAEDLEQRKQVIVDTLAKEFKKCMPALVMDLSRRKKPAIQALQECVLNSSPRSFYAEEIHPILMSELANSRSEFAPMLAECRGNFTPMLMALVQRKCSGVVIRSRIDKRVLALYAAHPAQVGCHPVYSRCDTWLTLTREGQEKEADESNEEFGGFGEDSASAYLAWSSLRKSWAVSSAENPDSVVEKTWIARCLGAAGLADGHDLADDPVAMDITGAAWQLTTAQNGGIIVTSATPDTLLRVAVEYFRGQQQLCRQCGTSPDDTETLDKLLSSVKDGSYEEEEHARIERLGWESIEDTRKATEEEKVLFPRMLATFERWLINDVTSIGVCSKKGYVFSMRQLFEEDPRSPDDMATAEFFRFVKQDERNRTGNGQRQAAIQYWIQFLPAVRGQPWDELPKDEKERRKYECDFEKKAKEAVFQDVQQEIEVPLEQIFPEQCGQEGAACFMKLRTLIGEDGFLIREVDAAGQLPVKRDLREQLSFATSAEWADVPKILKTFEYYIRKELKTSSKSIMKAEDAVAVEFMRDLFNTEALSPDTVAGDCYHSVVREEEELKKTLQIKLFREFWQNWQAEHSGEAFLDPSKGTFCPGVIPRLFKVLDLKDATARAIRRREVHAKYKIPLHWTVEVNADLSVKVKHPDGREFKKIEHAVSAFASERQAAKEAATKQAEKAVPEAPKEQGACNADGPAEKKRCRSSGFRQMQKGSDGVTDRNIDSIRDLVLRRHEWRLLGIRASSSFLSTSDPSKDLVPLSQAGSLQATHACAVFLFDGRAAKRQLEKKLREEWNLPDDWGMEVHPRLAQNLAIATEPKGKTYFSRNQVEVQGKLDRERQRRVRSLENLLEAVKLIQNYDGQTIFALTGVPDSSPSQHVQGLFFERDVDGRREYRKASEFNLVDEESPVTLRLVLPSESGLSEPRWVASGGPEDPVKGLIWGVATAESISSGGPPAVVGSWHVWNHRDNKESYAEEAALEFQRISVGRAEYSVADVLQQPVACCDFCRRPRDSRSLTAASDARLGHACRQREPDPEVLQAKDLTSMVKHMLSKLLRTEGHPGQKLKEFGHCRKIRVGTMCSGTDSPVLAMRAIADALHAAQCGSIDVQHIFSCENDRQKQKFLKANYPDMGILFDDVTKLGDKHAVDVISGKTVEVPAKADVIIAGFSCKDLSGMNRNRKALDEMGQSGATLQGCLNYVATHRPRVVIFENVRNICTRSQETNLRPVDLVMVALRRLGYSAGWKFVDTSQFYLPQSRARVWMWGYMDETIDPATIPRVAPSVEKLSEELVNSENKASATVEGPKNAEINEAVDRTLDFLKEPCAIHFDDLLLPDDDPQVEEFLKTMQGRDKKKSLIQASAKLTWDVKIQQHRDALRSSFSKPYTSYRGAPWLGLLNPRERELCDLNFNEVYEERGIDARQHPMLWEMSQSAGRVPGTRTREHRMHCSPCILPGNLWHTTRRRWVSGREKLRLQGIFENDVKDLSVVSEKTLGDMAGNAFSATVAAANILAAMIHGNL